MRQRLSTLYFRFVQSVVALLLIVCLAFGAFVYGSLKYDLFQVIWPESERKISRIRHIVVGLSREITVAWR